MKIPNHSSCTHTYMYIYIFVNMEKTRVKLSLVYITEWKSKQLHSTIYPQQASASIQRVIKNMPGRVTIRDTWFPAHQDKINHKHASEMLVYLILKDRVLQSPYQISVPHRIFLLMPSLTLLHFNPINSCSFLREHEVLVFLTAASNVFTDFYYVCLQSSVENCFILFSYVLFFSCLIILITFVWTPCNWNISFWK